MHLFSFEFSFESNPASHNQEKAPHLCLCLNTSRPDCWTSCRTSARAATAPWATAAAERGRRLPGSAAQLLPPEPGVPALPEPGLK